MIYILENGTAVIQEGCGCPLSYIMESYHDQTELFKVPHNFKLLKVILTRRYQFLTNIASVRWCAERCLIVVYTNARLFVIERIVTFVKHIVTQTVVLHALECIICNVYKCELRKVIILLWKFCESKDIWQIWKK
ncbi:Ribosomal protein S3 [Dirofilaria immitis]